MQGKAVSTLEDMISGMSPKMDERPYKYVTLPFIGRLMIGIGLVPSGFAFVWEDEGLTQVKETTTTDKGPLFGRITLMVHSDLEGVGLTAAVSTALADAGIACNVIAAFHHDHLFVPWDRRDEAMDVLGQLSSKQG